ncbi:MAG: FHA domain-containing protein [Myxococcota bacterium]
MTSLYEIVASVASVSRDAFAAAQAGPYLLRQLAAADDTPQWTFKTQTLPSHSVERFREIAHAGSVVPEALSGYEALAIVKSASNPWPNRISLGRARNNDIVILDPSISKLHAHFVRNEQGVMTVADVGSSNGTQVRGQPLTRGQVAELTSGDTVVFGAVSLRYYDAHGLYDYVAQFLGRAGSSG